MEILLHCETKHHKNQVGNPLASMFRGFSFLFLGGTSGALYYHCEHPLFGLDPSPGACLPTFRGFLVGRVKELRVSVLHVPGCLLVREVLGEEFWNLKMYIRTSGVSNEGDREVVRLLRHIIGGWNHQR